MGTHREVGRAGLLRLALLTCLSLLPACQGSSAGPALRATADSLMASGRGHLLLYARMQDGSLVEVADPQAWPEGTERSFAVLRDSAGTVLLLIEAPASGSDEWSIEYRHYFDAEGRTAFFRRYSGFFEGCEFGLARELLERSYTTSFEAVRELYSLTNVDGTAQDSTKCEFHYHFPYEVYPSWSAAAAASGIPATVSP